MLPRLAYGLLVLATAFLPLLVACGVIAVTLYEPADSSPAVGPITPNPSKAPVYLLGPADLLVAVDPWYAGTLLFWLVPWLGVLLGLAIVATIAAEPHALDMPMGWLRRRSTWLAIALAAGALFASPWIVGAVQLLLMEV